MKNKFVRFSLAILFLIPLVINAQTVNTASPYSRFGLGELQYNSSPRFLGMGSVTQGVNDSTYVNADNPASYTAVGKYTVFDFGARAALLKLQSSSQSANANSINFSHLFISFPIIKKHWALTLGVTPYSNEGYSFSQPKSLPTYGDIKMAYSGSGGINSMVFGNAFTLFRTLNNRSKTINIDTVTNRTLRRIMRDTMPETSRLSLGVNLNYLFGNLNTQSDAIFPDSLLALNSRQIRTVRVDGLAATIGLQYTRYLKKNNVFTLGATYSRGVAVGAKENIFAATYVTSLGNDFYVDTLINNQSNKGSIVLPSTYGLGFVFRHENRWTLGADFKMQDWGGYRMFGKPNDQLSNGWQAAVGGQIVPDPYAKKFSLQRTAYRFGARYGRSYLNLNNTPVNEWGVSLGLGFLLNPIGVYQRIYKVPFSSVNVGVEYGRRGTTTNNLIREDFLRISLAFTFSDKWFNKYKYD